MIYPHFFHMGWNWALLIFLPKAFSNVLHLRSLNFLPSPWTTYYVLTRACLFVNTSLSLTAWQRRICPAHVCDAHNTYCPSQHGVMLNRCLWFEMTFYHKLNYLCPVYPSVTRILRIICPFREQMTLLLAFIDHYHYARRWWW